MRRFEFTEGTSSKFWSIALDGTSFTVQWGRIGTAGQSQTKTFPTDAKARAAHDKLVQEKLDKGYAEVSSTPSAASATAPKPPPAPAPSASAPSAPAKAAPTKAASAPAAAAKAAAAKAAATTATNVAPAAPATPTPSAPLPSTASDDAHDAPDGTIAWTPSLTARVAPRRGGRVAASPPSLDAKKAWATMLAQVEKIRPQLRLGKRVKDADADVIEAIDERFDPRSKSAPPDPASADVEAAIHRLLQATSGWRGSPSADQHVVYLVGRAGAAFTTEVVVRALGWTQSEKAQKAFALVRGPCGHWASIAGGRPGPLAILRAHLAAASDDVYAAARDVAAKLRRESPGYVEASHLSAATSYLFPTERDWVRNDVASLGTRGPGRTRDPSLLLLFAIDAAADLDTLVAGRSPYELVGADSDPTATLLDGLGTAAIPFFTKLLGEAGIAEWKRDIAECLSAIADDGALTPLLAKLDDKQIGPFALQAALRWPRRALRLLAPLATTRGKAGDPARALLDQIVRAHGSHVDGWAAGLPDDARKLIASMRAESAVTVRDARADELPAILASPPWRAARARPEPHVVAGLSVLPTPDRMAWAEDEKAAWQNLRGNPWYTWQHKGLSGEALWQAELARLGKTAKNDNRFDPAFLIDAPAEVGRPFLERWTVSTWHAVGWIQPLVAKFELELLPSLLAFAEHKPVDVFEGLLPYAVASLAPKMADALVRLKTIRPIARRWLLRHPEVAAVGLVPLAVGVAGKERDAAEHAIRFLVAEGREATVREVADRYGPRAREALEDVLAFDPLQLFPAKLPKMPSFWSAATLPKPLLRNREAALPEAAVEALGEMLAFSTLDAPYAGIEAVRQACDPASLARFSWALFQGWLQSGAASKEQWAFTAMGFLGDDESARKLAALVREWPGESAHARAVVGLDVLAAIGTDVALMHLNRIAEKLKFKGLQDKAREKIGVIAESRGMTQEELADRLAPDLGLDPDGSLTLDFGPRAFKVGFDEHLHPYVQDASGARIGDLPKPGKADDAEKAKEAKERWQSLKKDAKTAASTQVIRLELAMCKQRRFTKEVFRSLFVEHPLLAHVVRRLVWATFDEDGNLRDTFRVAEDRTFANASDDAWEMPEGALVGIPHPLELPADVAARWGQVLADYEILQPFAQLGREVFSPSASERSGKVIERVEHRKIATGSVLGLEPRGWRRGPALDGGVVGWMIKPLGDGREARLDLDPGLFTGMLSEAPEQTLGKVYVAKAGGWGWVKEEAVALDSVSPIVFSEVVRDVTSLESK